MSTRPNRGRLRRPLRGAELKKDQTAKFSRSGWFDSHQPASTKAGVVHWRLKSESSRLISIKP